MVLSTIRAMVIESFCERRRAGSQESFLVGAIIEAVDRVDDTTHVNVDGPGGGVGSGASASGSTASATTSKKEVLLCYVNNISEDVLKQKLLDLIPRQKIILTNVLKFPSSYRLSANSKVISRVSDFDVDEATVENFIRPDVVSVAEARGSPSKRRLSVSGDVVEVGPCVNTAAFKRRCLQMEGCGASVEVVLWGEAALKDVSCGKAVITALVKDGGRLTSTVSSQIESSSSVVASGVIVGMEDAENGFPIEVVLHNGESLFIDESLFIGDFNFNMKLPVKVEYTVASGGHVQSIAVGKQ